MEGVVVLALFVSFQPTFLKNENEVYKVTMMFLSLSLSSTNNFWINWQIIMKFRGEVMVLKVT
jgi:hypothetical protein